MIDVKSNFKNKHRELTCRLGCTALETDNNLLKCDKINSEPKEINLNKVTENNLKVMLKIEKEVEIALLKRKYLLEELNVEIDVKKRKYNYVNTSKTKTKKQK